MASCSKPSRISARVRRRRTAGSFTPASTRGRASVESRLLRGFYGGKAFLGSGGVHPVLGLTDYYPDEIRMRRVIINQAHECYVLADSSKLGRIAPAKVCDLDQVTAVITDDGVDDAVARDFERVGVKLLIAEVRRSPGAD